MTTTTATTCNADFGFMYTGPATGWLCRSCNENEDKHQEQTPAA